MTNISTLSDTPQYTILRVAEKTGILPVTLRAWERRYQLGIPQRGLNRYRYYSDREIGVLLWVKRRMSEGASISTAVNELNSMIEQGEWPDVEYQSENTSSASPRHKPSYYLGMLYKNLLKHDEFVSLNIINDARDDLGTQGLGIEVLTPVLVAIGEAWHRGDIRIVDEHFASMLIRGWINTVLLEESKSSRKPQILIGCAPSELHEIGSMILALLLRGQGYSVEYLGCDVPVADIISYVSDIHPRLVILSATMASSINQLVGVREKLTAVAPKTEFGFGGRAFNQNPKLKDTVSGLFLGETFNSSIEAIQKLLR